MKSKSIAGQRNFIVKLWLLRKVKYDSNLDVLSSNKIKY